ncbi:hypothetical protein CK230_24095 [Mesorhizobium sp. WSM3859]|nr:hypothetical protein CK230_24095 [Mesorhizobium sp. WSM3859]
MPPISGSASWISKRTPIYQLGMGSGGFSWNEIARIRQIGDFDFLVILVPWGKLLQGGQEEK